MRKINEKVDIQVYNLLPDKIKNEIDLKGRKLYERKNKGEEIEKYLSELAEVKLFLLY